MTAADEERIRRLDLALREILEEELRRGNQIVETSEGWPQKGSIFVLLRLRFVRRYDRDGVVFRSVEDPHWWKEEYHSASTAHVLACQFG